MRPLRIVGLALLATLFLGGVAYSQDSSAACPVAKNSGDTHPATRLRAQNLAGTLRKDAFWLVFRDQNPPQNFSEIR
jgi:hypothetical protein